MKWFLIVLIVGAGGPKNYAAIYADMGACIEQRDRLRESRILAARYRVFSVVCEPDLRNRLGTPSELSHDDTTAGRVETGDVSLAVGNEHARAACVVLTASPVWPVEVQASFEEHQRGRAAEHEAVKHPRLGSREGERDPVPVVGQAF